MAHMQKMKSGAVAPMMNHYERKFEGTRKRENIDASKTHYNQVLVRDKNKTKEDLTDLVKERIDEVYKSHQDVTGKKVRSDAVIMADWVVTAPEELKKEDENEFFGCVLMFMSERYGEKNILGGFIHRDEMRTHMHVPVVPEIDGKFNAKKLLSRNDLKTFHNELQKHIDKKFDYHVSILLDDSQKEKKALSKLSHEEIRALDANEKIDQVKKLKIEIQELEKKKEIYLANPDHQVLGDEKVRAVLLPMMDLTDQAQEESRIEFLNDYSEVPCEVITDELDDSIGKVKGFGKAKKIEIKMDDWEKIKSKHNRLVSSYKALRKDFLQKAEVIVNALKVASKSPHKWRIKRQQDLEKEIEILKNEKNQIRDEMEKEFKPIFNLARTAIQFMDEEVETKDGKSFIDEFANEKNISVRFLEKFLRSERRKEREMERKIERMNWDRDFER